MSLWEDKGSIAGVVLDINGVLYDNSNEGIPQPIPGSIDAIKQLYSSNIPVRFCTNETTVPSSQIVRKLIDMGFQISQSDVFSPIPALKSYLKKKSLRPHLLVHPDVRSEFEDVNCENPNCVVLGDAQQSFSYDNLNSAFSTLISLNLKESVLIALGCGKYYKQGDGLVLDVGPYMKALEFACDTKAEIVGKPSRSFFLAAVEDMGCTPERTVMIGDDIVSDVGGAQAAGLKGVQVRTGKYRPTDEPHPTVTPDAYVDNLQEAVAQLLK